MKPKFKKFEMTGQELSEHIHAVIELLCKERKLPVPVAYFVVQKLVEFTPEDMKPDMSVMFVKDDD